MTVSTAILSNVVVHRLRIPLKSKVEHAAKSRSAADPIVVEIESRGGEYGYGETLPRVYVTGEDHNAVEHVIEEHYIPRLAEMNPGSFAEALEFIEDLPERQPDGTLCSAARAAVELALLDVYSRIFDRPIGRDVLNWIGLPVLDSGQLPKARCSGVLATTDVDTLRKQVRKMRCYGLRDFKLKVGVPEEDELVRAAADALRSGLTHGRASLRLDANGGWSLEQAIAALMTWQDLGLACVEQPLAKGDESLLQDLKAASGWQLMHDESLVTMNDAERLFDLGVADYFNIRVSKCGGFIPALRLIAFCRKHQIRYAVGCMVGQTSLLSAVERHVLDCAVGVRFVEGNFGSFLLTDDILRPQLRFGYGGKLKLLEGPGWGIKVDRSALERLSEGGIRRFKL
jgi:muconate cycloisomerase